MAEYIIYNDDIKEKKLLYDFYNEYVGFKPIEAEKDMNYTVVYSKTEKSDNKPKKETPLYYINKSELSHKVSKSKKKSGKSRRIPTNQSKSLKKEVKKTRRRRSLRQIEENIQFYQKMNRRIEEILEYSRNYSKNFGRLSSSSQDTPTSTGGNRDYTSLYSQYVPVSSTYNSNNDYLNPPSVNSTANQFQTMNISTI